jgi:N-acetyl-anhydromuramyl-L-alanine amidase AmpD
VKSKAAQHAGLSYWRGVTDCNSASIGIEIVNPGHEFGYRPFPEAQMDSVTRLVAGIVGTYGIDPRNVVGHSDVAPTRKEDPGELFDWERLAKLGLAVPRPTGKSWLIPVGRMPRFCWRWNVMVMASQMAVLPRSRSSAVFAPKISKV